MTFRHRANYSRVFSPCAGNSTENCGNPQSSAVGFYNTAGAVPVTANKPVGYKGCFNDNIGSRQLPGYTYTSDNMTNTNCAVTCAGKGFALSGTQGGSKSSSPLDSSLIDTDTPGLFCRRLFLWRNASLHLVARKLLCLELQRFIW